jgi:flagellar biosynthesis protein FlhG
MVLCKSSLWTVGSGKGGVGKSHLAVSMGIALARSGMSVVLADASMTAPDLHDMLGIKMPGVSLRDVWLREASISDALVPTPEPNLRFVSCAGDEFGITGLGEGECSPLIECIRSLQADYVLADAGTGTAPAMLDLLNAAHEAIVVSSPDPASMRCTFRYIRNAIFRRVQEKYSEHPAVVSAIQRMHPRSGAASSLTMADFLALLQSSSPETACGIDSLVKAWHPKLLVNMADSEQDQRVAEIIRSAVKKILNVELTFGGLIPFDGSLRKTSPRALVFSERGGEAAQQIAHFAGGLAENARGSQCMDTHPASAVSPIMGLNDNLVLLGRDIHVQTEDLGAAVRGIMTQVFCGGRVILSTKSEYPVSMRDPLQSAQLAELMRNQHFGVIRQIENRKMKSSTGLAENS